VAELLYALLLCCLCVQCGPKIATYPWPAEDLLSCVSRHASLTAAPIDRPTIAKHPLFPVGLLATIVVGGTVAWKLYNSPIVRITGLWTLGALGVYWFATSGGMYNIIRGIPFSMTNQQGKKVYWMEVRGAPGNGEVMATCWHLRKEMFAGAEQLMNALVKQPT